jgi:IPT/TIG domain
MASHLAYRWIKNVVQKWRSRPPLSKRTGRLFYRLHLEVLEDRVVPSSWVVTNTSNSSSTSGSLPWAVLHANSDSSNASITFSPSVFYNGATVTLAATLTLTNTAHSITIDGASFGPISVSGAGSVQDFHINSGVTANILNLTIANGHGSGGGVYNAGTLALTNDIVTGNSSSNDGGGLYNTGTANLTDVTLSNNSAPGSGLHGGGGAYNTGTMRVTECNITGNTTNYDGAGLNNSGTMIVKDSSFSGNTAGWGALQTHDGKTTVVGSTFTGNNAIERGGAVWLTSSGTTTTLSMIDCTLTGNTAQNGGDTSQQTGGAIATNNLSNLNLNLIDCTISGNSATVSGGGMFIWSSSTVVTMSNTIVAANSAGTSSPDISGAVSGNNNLIGNGTGMSGITNGSNGNQVGTSSTPIDPLLNALANNGGPTQTMSEQSGSPALGAGGAVTTLSLAINSTTTTTITIANLSHLAASALATLPAGSYFTIQIDGEQMAVTGAGTSTLTVIRGINGTTAATHASGASVFVVSEQRHFLVPAATPLVVDRGAFQNTAIDIDPTISAVNPSSGDYGGGISVTITGANFTGATAVKFGVNNAASFTVNSATQITAVAPAGAGVVDVRVTTPLGGASSIVAADQFTYTVVTSSALSFITQPTGGTAGSSLGLVTVSDLNGSSPVSGAIVALAVSSGVLNGTTTATTDTSGVATFSNLSVPTAGTYTLTASSFGATSATSDPFTMTAPPPIVVTTNSDAVSHSGTSLRDAIATANADAAAGQSISIVFATSMSGQTITLAQGTLNLTAAGGAAITIDGSGSTPITVSGNHAVEVFSVNPNVNATITNLIIANGQAGNGGGIISSGNLTLTNDVLSGNSATYEGGGLYNSGIATLAYVTMFNNTMNGSGGGGGGAVFNSGTISIANSAFTGNSSNYSSGAISASGTTVITNTTFSDNVASWGAMEVHDGVATVIGCTFTGNTSSNGGAVWMSNYGGPTSTLTMIDCTLTGNRSTGNGGGAIATNNLSNLSLNLVHCTIVGNTAVNAGGGLYIGSTSTPVMLKDTIVAGNLFNASPSDIYGTVSGSNNLIGVSTGMSGITNGSNGNQVGTTSSPINPLLNALASNGGPTQTMSEQTGSPAIGTGGAVTTLNTAVNDTTTTSISVASLALLAPAVLSTLASGCYYTIQIDGEQMAVIGATTSALTVLRGVNGTSAATHSSGASVYVVSDQRGYVIPSSGSVVDKGASESTGVSTVPVSSLLSFSSQPTSTYLNASLGTVTVADMNGSIPVTGATVTITISSGALNGTRTAITDASGIATFTNLSAPMTGSYTLTASSSGQLATSNSFTISAGPPLSLVVTTNSDATSHSGTSLRDAMITANAAAAAGKVVTITFASSVSGQTITLAQGTLGLTGLGVGSVTIDGSGSTPITVSGNHAVEVFSVNPNVNATITNLIIANGQAGNGGGIISSGNLTLTNDVLSGNSATYEGGGLYNTGTATLAYVTMTSNAMNGTGGSGGGGAVFNSGTISIANSAFTGNSSNYSSGAISASGTTVITNTTFSDNVASWGAMEVHDGVATVIGCTFTGNTSSNGGAVWMSIYGGPASMLTMVDCTLTGNTSTGSGGGAIATNNLSNLSLNLVHCTIVGNSAANAGGGLRIGSTSTPVTLKDTIVAGNLFNASPSDIYGTVSGSNNLIGVSTGMSGITNGSNGNQVGTTSSPINPLLNALASNGGPTQTMSEQTGSPAIGTGGAVTTLNSAVSDVTTSRIPVANLNRLAGTALPTLPVGSYYTIQIDNEEMAVTGAAAFVLTVVRGINGTAAASHLSGASVYVVSDQRHYVVSSANPPAVDKGAYEHAAVALAPAVLSLSPATGPAAGGMTVVIAGSNFTGATAVMFGTANTVSFTINSDSQITAICPTGVGVVDVTVTTATGGTSATSPADQFTYISPTTTTLVDNGPNPSTLGQAVSFTVTVSSGSGDDPLAEPSSITSETVDIEDADNANAIVASPTLVNGTVTFTISDLTVGTHDLFAVYNGDATNAGSNSSATPVTQVVNYSGPAPAWVSDVVNGGTPQYVDQQGMTLDISNQNSVVLQILVTFNEPVTLSPGAFSVIPFAISTDGNVRPGQVLVNSGANPNQAEVDLNAPIQVGDGHQWIVTFANSPGTHPNGDGAYLIDDGVYTLHIDHTKVQANAQTMAADNDTGFWALYGDVTNHQISGVDLNVGTGYVGDGYSDASVGCCDFAVFKQYYNTDSSNDYAPPDYYLPLDYDLDGSEAASDFAHFKVNFNTDWQF